MVVDNIRRSIKALWYGTLPDRKILRNITRCALLWPIVLIFVALLPTIFGAVIGKSIASNLVAIIPIMTLIPMILFLWLLTTPDAIGVLTVIAILPKTTSLIGKSIDLGKIVIEQIIRLLFMELLIGITLSILPIQNDPKLVPLFVISCIALTMAFLIPTRALIRKSLIWGIVVMALIFIFGGRENLQEKINHQTKNFPYAAVIPSSREMSNTGVCSDAWTREAKHLDDHRAEDIAYFDVQLTHGDCYEDYQQPPTKWVTWDKEFIDPQPGDQVSFWFVNNDPIGPFGPGGLPQFNYAPRKWRMKGKGTVRYYRTDK
jgi:hypothetical protein